MKTPTHDYLDIAKQIVLRHIDSTKYKVFLFGSRAVGNAKPKSDIDIGIWGNQRLPAVEKLTLEEELSESIVPYKIDIVDFTQVDEDFKKMALEKIIPWQ